MLDEILEIDTLIYTAVTTILPELSAAGCEVGRDILLASCVDSAVG